MSNEQRQHEVSITSFLELLFALGTSAGLEELAARTEDSAQTKEECSLSKAAILSPGAFPPASGTVTTVVILDYQPGNPMPSQRERWVRAGERVPF